MVSFKEAVAANAGKSAIKTGIAHELSATGIAPVLRGYVAAFEPDHASNVLNMVRAGVMEKRKADGITKPMPPVRPSRISELKSVLRLRSWACRNGLFDVLEKANASLDAVVTVSKWIRANVDAKIGACPKREKILAVINARKKERNNVGGKRKRVVNPLVSLDMIDKHAKALAGAFGKGDGGAFITAMMKASASFRPIAVKIKAAQDKARAEKPKK